MLTTKLSFSDCHLAWKCYLRLACSSVASNKLSCTAALPNLVVLFAGPNLDCCVENFYVDARCCDYPAFKPSENKTLWSTKLLSVMEKWLIFLLPAFAEKSLVLDYWKPLLPALHEWFDYGLVVPVHVEI